MQQYRIGAISKVMNIPVDTLRFYESLGIIKPKKDARNGYRYYTVTDIGNLLEYIRCRKMDISGKESVKIIQKDNLQEYITCMENNKDNLLEQQKRYSLLYAYQTEHLEKLEDLGKELYRFKIVTSPEIYYFNNRSENYFAPVGDLGPLMENWLQYLPFVEQFCKIKLDALQNTREELSYRLGMCIRKKWAIQLGMDVAGPHIYYVPPQMAVHVTVGMKNFVIDRAPLLEGLQYIHDHHFIANGDIMGNTIASVNDEKGESIQYVELYFPIRE